MIPPDPNVGRSDLKPRGWLRGRHRRAVLVGVIALVVVAALIAVASRFEVRAQMERVVGAVREAGPVPFFAAMAVLPGMGFPLSAFLAIAGPVFGPTLGVGVVIVCAIAAITVNVALSYWAAARVLRPPAQWLIHRLGYPMPEIPVGTAWSAILILRVVPGTPFFLQSLLLGLARVPFGPYMLVSTLVPATHVIAMVMLGAALMRGDGRAIAIAAVMFFIAGGIIHQVRRRLLRRTAVSVSASEKPLLKRD